MTSSVFTDPVEDGFGDLLQKFTVPATERDELVTLWRRTRMSAGDGQAERNRIERRLERLKDLYIDGTIDRSRFQQERSDLARQLTA